MNILILTDHSTHTPSNSLYALANVMLQDDRISSIDIASRGSKKNDYFFNVRKTTWVYTIEVTENFTYEKAQIDFKKPLELSNLKIYDIIFLRLPPPLSKDFCAFLMNNFEEEKIINHPNGIFKTGSKQFLLNFPELCAPIKHCKTVEDIRNFAYRFPIVLKPFDNYGGKGILRIEDDQVWRKDEVLPFDECIMEFEEELEKGGYLGMKFLKNVTEGDKRILVVNGEIVGSSLRKPATGQWLCNASMGGSPQPSTVSLEEKNIAKTLAPILLRNGIAMFGFDTLVNDNGKRVLSEINTTSIGGILQAEQLSGEPVLKRTAEGLINFMVKKTR